MVDKVSDTHYKLVSEVYELKKDFAFKQEEVQALYLEVKQQRNLAEKYELENKHLKPVSYTHLTLPTIYSV